MKAEGAERQVARQQHKENVDWAGGDFLPLCLD